MRRSPLATALVVLTAGVTATALRRLARRRSAAAALSAAAAAAVRPAAVAQVAAEPTADATPDAVVLPFTRPAAPAAPAAPARCGDSGGLTRAGAPCASRATAGGRCHHHRVAELSASA